MQLKNEMQTGWATEVKIIPGWAIVLAAIGFVAAQVSFDVLIARQSDAPAMWVRVLLGLMLGVVVGCYLLLIGYVNRDARRRAMSPLLWTIVAVFIPNGLGILLYFILRQPLPGSWRGGGNGLSAGPGSCPRCGYVLGPSCAQCKRAVSAGDVYCRYCGTSLHAMGGQVAASGV